MRAVLKDCYLFLSLWRSCCLTLMLGDLIGDSCKSYTGTSRKLQIVLDKSTD